MVQIVSNWIEVARPLYEAPGFVSSYFCYFGNVYIVELTRFVTVCHKIPINKYFNYFCWFLIHFC